MRSARAPVYLRVSAPNQEVGYVNETGLLVRYKTDFLKERFPVADLDAQLEELWDLSYKVAYRVLGDREEAADVAQDTLIRVAERWGRVRAHAPGFAAKVAGQRAIDVWRRRRRVVLAAVPERILPLDDDERSDLIAALQQLPKRQREVVVLRYIADLSQDDTAKALGCSPGTVKQSSARGLAALRSSLTTT